MSETETKTMFAMLAQLSTILAHQTTLICAIASETVKDRATVQQVLDAGRGASRAVDGFRELCEGLK